MDYLTPGGANNPLYLAQLAAHFYQLYKLTSDQSALDRAIDYYEQALELTPENHPVRLVLLAGLGNALLALYERTSDQGAFERGVDYYQQALELTPENHSARSAIFNNLGSAFSLLYENIGDQGALDRAIDYYEQALKLLPENHPDRPGLLSNLGRARLRLYERTSDQNTFEQAIDHYRQALELTPENHPVRLVLLAGLGGAFLTLYKGTGDRGAFERAIDYFEQALELTPENHPVRLAQLAGLGNALLDLYERTGDQGAFERAIDYFEQALELTPENHSARSAIFNNLGSAFSLLYENIGDQGALDRAIDYYEQALKLLPENHPDRPGLLSNLGSARLHLYERTSDQSMFERAIAALSEAIEGVPENHLDRPGWLSNLGGAFLTLYKGTGDQGALDRAIDYYEQALELTPENHTDRASRLSNLGSAFLGRYERTGDQGALDRAIDYYEQALKLLPENHPDRPGLLGSLGGARLLLYGRTGDQGALERAIAALSDALELGTNLNPMAALMAGWDWIILSFARGNWHELKEVYQLTLFAVRQYIIYQTDRRDLTHTLSRFQALPALAAWAQVELGDYREAVTALESGRTFVLREALERGRRDLERLPVLGYPDLYARFEGAKQKLQELERTPFEHRPKDWLSRMSEAREELERAAEEIREKVGDRHPEYRFLMGPLPFGEIEKLAAEAPLVYLLTTPRGGLALVVQKGGDPQAVHLPRLTERGLLWVFRGKGDEPGSVPDPESYYGAYDGWRKEDSPEKRKAWFDAIERALDFLGEALAPLREFLDLRGYKRVTLIPAGILAALPLHAARFKDGKKGTYFLEHHTFSYAPSAHALYYALLAKGDSESEPLLAVENPNGDLAHAALEVKAIREHFTRVKHLAREEAAVEAVKEALPDAGVFHFSGHGAGGWGGEEPRLQLADGVLTFSELLRSGQTLDRLRLAVLSACETGVSDLKAPNEYLGLPAGFLLAGAPGVVGSLWSVPDVETALLIVRFYEGLCSGKADSGKVDAAEALREAQTWMLRMSPEEKHASLARLDAKLGNSALAGTRMSLEAAEGPSDLIESGGRKVKHPYYWAAFGYYGVPVKLERCGKRREG